MSTAGVSGGARGAGANAERSGGGSRGGSGGLLPALVLSLCPAIAMTDSVIDALWISAGVIMASVLSSLAGCALQRSSTPQGAVPVPWSAPGLLRALLISSVLAAAFEAGLLMVSPAASASLGIYAPLIAVNVLVMGAVRPAPVSVAGSAAGALARGAVFAAALLAIALVREALGSGTITLFPVGAFRGTIVIGPLADRPVRALGLAGGALLCLGYLAGALQAVTGGRAGADGQGPQ